MAWRGRQLTGYAKNGVTSTFKYDADGLRSSKTVGGVKTEYQYVGDRLFYEKRGDSQEFYYFYDSYGNLSKIYYTLHSNGTTSRAVYHALTNAQGDVVALYNSAGNLVAQYEYDAWGNTLSIKDALGVAITAWYNIAVANPIRYRGYYYDADLGLYYLQSRYYDSTIGRFINADGTLNGNGDVLGFNMFAYCGNNPVMNIDPSGMGLLIAVLIAIGVVAVTAVGITHAENYSNKNAIDTQVKDSYTKQEAKEHVDATLSKYSTPEAPVEINFYDNGAEISNSYLVDSKYDRQYVSTIISNTGVTSRSYDDISAEWNYHNVMYNIQIKPIKDPARSAFLDYGRDDRFFLVVLPYECFELLGWD